MHEYNADIYLHFHGSPCFPLFYVCLLRSVSLWIKTYFINLTACLSNQLSNLIFSVDIHLLISCLYLNCDTCQLRKWESCFGVSFSWLEKIGCVINVHQESDLPFNITQLPVWHSAFIRPVSLYCPIFPLFYILSCVNLCHCSWAKLIKLINIKVLLFFYQQYIAGVYSAHLF